MVAAARGRLALVRLLVEEFGADDGVVAPDGQIALRLAAEGGHREVVDYLPRRRGGAWRRWQVQHHVAVRRVKGAVRKIAVFFEVLLWHVPKFLVWRVPKHLVVLPLLEAGRYCWANKRRFGGWCKRQAAELPGRAKRAGKAAWRVAKKVPVAAWKVAKKVPGTAWKVAKAVPRVVEDLIRCLWEVIKRIPAAVKKIGVWMWESSARVGKALGHVLLRIASLLHTAVSALLGVFRRIKLRDVWNGVCGVLVAVFRGVPWAIFMGISVLGGVVAAVVIGLFGAFGKLIVLLVEALWYVAKYVPRQLGVILAGIWASVSKGCHEFMVFLNPKH
ncbi:hypothetical protein BT67DRAFT_444234 [Trichocladium antarcticum]|uniref:Uncharacterized protein n=1 Tax=Trichocladium antarcticum TaxID=1450529 RepID=A0AAN6UF30_9PEZI|nr:hypothetical protein BT67DRAFT_444234 [Trichocladium antarcticum]